MSSHPAMPGVTAQVLRRHSGNSVAYPMAIDRRDYSTIHETESPHEFCCTELVHFTENDFAASIGIENGNEFRFQARQWRVTSAESFKLTWWSPVPPHDWKEIVDNNLPNIWHEFDDIGNSRAFNGESLCGPIGFVISYRHLLEQYAISRQSDLDDVELRILGTFLYTKEIMYAVLVCIKGDDGVESYPVINTNGTEAFEPSESDFIWKVYSTVGFSENRPSDVQWTWDHLAFGFNCPISNLIIQPQLCRIIGEECAAKMPLSRPGLRTPQDRVPHDDLLDLLREETHDY